MESYGQRLHRLLDKRHYGKPLSKVAKEAGVDLATVQNALADKTNPRFPTQEKLAAYVGVSVEYLITGEGSPEPPAAHLPEIRARVDEALKLLQGIADDLNRQQSNGKP